jgi:KaiC/GvpD/RAD55 family RecA-like ATPase
VTVEAPAFLRKFDKYRDRDGGGWFATCPQHMSEGFTVVVYAIPEQGRYGMQCVEAIGNDVCAQEGRLLELLGIAQDELRLSPNEAAATPRRWQLRPLADAIPRQTRWLVPGLIPLRFLTLVAGIGGLGKSTWLLALAAAGSVADEPWDTIYVSFEDTADEVLRPRIDAAGGDPGRVHELVLADAEALDSFSLPRDVEDLQQLVRECQARLVVIDPVVAAVEAKLDAYKDQHVRQVLARLWRVSREEDCAVSMVGHLNRVPSTDAYLRIANSTAFWNASRSVVLITQDGDDGSDLRLIAQRKANLARLAPVERHRLEEIVLPEIVDPETGKPIVTPRMTFVETADDVNGADLLGPQKTTKTETAESLLEVLLGDGEWRESQAVQRVLAAAEFNERLAQRAAKDLGVEHERRGFPAVTWWRLPVPTSPVATNTGSQDVATRGTVQPSRSQDVADPVATSPSRTGSDPTAQRPMIGDANYWRFLVAALEADAITVTESEQQYALHNAVAARRSDGAPGAVTRQHTDDHDAGEREGGTPPT